MNYSTPIWQSLKKFPNYQLPKRLFPWLTHPGSFMQRLETVGIQSAVINVLKQEWQIPMPEEKEFLQLEEAALVREVLISDNQSDFMFARSVFPAATLTGDESQLAHLDNRSLGSVLFTDPDMQRSEFEIAEVQRDSVLGERLQQFKAITYITLWARRSCFQLRGKKVLLTEIFLPGMDSVC